MTSTTDRLQEQSFIMIKPDGVQRKLVGRIIERFEQKGFQLVSLKMVQANESLLRQHYAQLADRSFFPSLLQYMQMGPVVAMVWKGDGVVSICRQMLGETDPKKAKPGTIRGDYAIQAGRNIIHASDSIQSAKREIELWFASDDQLMQYKPSEQCWIYEN